MVLQFIILSDVEVAFHPTNTDAAVGLETTGEEMVEEFELSNFTGKIFVKRNGQKAPSIPQSTSSVVDSIPSTDCSVDADEHISGAVDKVLENASSRNVDLLVRSSSSSATLASQEVDKPPDHSEMIERSPSGSDQGALEAGEPRIPSESGHGLDEGPVQESRDSSLVLAEEVEFRVGPGSELHLMCDSKVASVDDLRACLAKDPRAPFIFNENGQTPLHVLADNATLWKMNAVDAFEFSTELIGVNPAAVALTDRCGRWPFASILKEWTEDQGRQSSSEQSNLLRYFVRSVGSAASSAVPKASLPAYGMAASEVSSHKINGKKTNLTEVFRSALELLSYSFTSTATMEQIPVEQQLVLRDRTCKNIANDFPLFLQNLLMLEPEASRIQVLSLPLIRRLLLEPITVGPWIVNMMRSKGTPSRRAVDYLEMLSDTCFQDFLPDASVADDGGDTEGANDILQLYRQRKTEVFDSIGEMGQFLLSLFAISKNEMQRATSTKVLWHVIHYLLQRQFIIGIVMIDFVLHLTWMLSFRADVIGSSSTTIGFSSATAGIAVTAITAFFALRKISEGIALFSLSKTVFRHYVLDFWNLFDLLSIVLLLAANGLNANGNQLNPGFNSFVLALLWLKILGFLKAVNRQMATFILACIQIVIDIRYFLLVMVVIIMMFGDIMVIVFQQTKDSVTGENICALQDETDAQGAFCSPHSFDSYFRMYGILLGDFDINDYKFNKIVVVVFLFFTMMGVIILLNILIAVVSDSYEKATIRSKALFGIARVGFLAEHIALEHFLQPGTNPLKGITQSNAVDPRRCFVFLKRIIRSLILLAIVVAATLAEVFLVELTIDGLSGSASMFVAVVTVAMSFVLTVSLWVVLHYLFTGFMAGHTFNVPLISPLFKAINWIMLGCISGLRKFAFGDGTVGDDEQDEWAGRMEFISRVVTSTVAEAEGKLMSRIQTAEDAVKENEELLLRRFHQELRINGT